MMDNQSKKLIKWRYVGKGRLVLLNGDNVGPGAVFEAAQADIPKMFLDVVKPLNQSDLEQAIAPPLDAVKPEYSIVVREPGLYDVIGPNNKAINEKGLDRMEALELIDNLLQ